MAQLRPLTGVLAVVAAVALTAAACEPAPEAPAPPPTTTTTTAPPATAAMPTHDTTGPDASLTGGDITAAQFLATRTCDHQRVVGNVRFEHWSGSGAPVRWTARQCHFTGQVFILYDGFYPESQYPTVDFDRVQIDGGLLLLGGIKGSIVKSDLAGGFWAPCPNCTNVHWKTTRAMPIAVRDTLFHSTPPSSPDGYHYEALHVMGSSTGMSFDNVRFYIKGPYNGTQTGAILFDADQATFRNVYFDFGGTPAASYYTVYIGGSASPHVSIDGCRIEKGLAAHVYPGGTANHDSVKASWRNCVDWRTGAAVTPS